MTETIISYILKESFMVGVMLIILYYQNKNNNKRIEDYNNLVSKIQDENLKRELNYTSTIDKLTESLDVVQDVDKKIDKLTYIIEQK